MLSVAFGLANHAGPLTEAEALAGRRFSLSQDEKMGPDWHWLSVRSFAQSFLVPARASGFGGGSIPKHRVKHRWPIVACCSLCDFGKNLIARLLEVFAQTALENARNAYFNGSRGKCLFPVNGSQLVAAMNAHNEALYRRDKIN